MTYRQIFNREVVKNLGTSYLPDLGQDTCYHHSTTVYDEVLRVPLIVRGPGVQEGRRLRQRYVHFDFAPTLLARAGSLSSVRLCVLP